MTIWTRSFWKAWGERVLWTLVQIAIGFGTAFLQNGMTFNGWDWKNTLLAISVSTVTAMLKGIGANAITKTGPSSGNSEQVMPELPAPADS